MAYGIQNELLKAYGEAAQQIAERRRSGGNRKSPETTKERLKKIRRDLDMSQTEFAECFQLAFSTVKNWEQDSRGEPKGLADIYIRMIEADPQAVLSLIEKIKESNDSHESRSYKKEEAE